MAHILNVLSPSLCPDRLSRATHDLAYQGLSGVWAKQMVYSAPELSAQIPSEGVSDEMRYALAVKLIAETAPLRVLADELIIGSATYLEAPEHKVPILDIYSTSHLTLGFDRVMLIGYRGLRKEIALRLLRGGLDEEGVDLLNCMLVCLDAAGIWHARHAALLKDRIASSDSPSKDHYQLLLETMRDIPENPPRNFHQAVQALWFMFEFQRLCGNWSALGRLDQMLGPYLEKDLANGTLTLDEGREILAHFFVHGTEWAGIQKGGGDAQHYQNIVLAGVDSDGREITNPVTYLVLDIIEELHISDFPIAVRVHPNSPDTLLRRIAEVQKKGGGIVSIYNEPVVLQGLVKLGIPLQEARTFANDGCWEVLIPGKTAFGYHSFDMLAILQDVLGLGETPQNLSALVCFEDLYTRFLQALSQRLDAINEVIDHAHESRHPATLISMFIEGCVEKGRGYYHRGAKYIFQSPHAGGLGDTANSLLAIKRMVFDEKVVSLEEFVDILRRDWEGKEDLRKYIRKQIEFYGNDNLDADEMLRRLFEDYTGIVWKTPFRNGVYRPAGISTFGREIEWRSHRKAAAHGFHLGALLATNFSPTPQTDMKGPTAVVKSYCKMDFTRLPNGGTLELKIHPSAVSGEDGTNSLAALMRSFIVMGGFYLNIDVIDSNVLRDAQAHPEHYPNLAVRISGWCARFNTLSKEWQDMIIQRTQHEGF